MLSQTFRTLIDSRLEVGMAAYQRRFHADIVLLEPQRDDYQMFFTNISASRRAGRWRSTPTTPPAPSCGVQAELEPVFARHGIGLRHDVLAEAERDMWDHVSTPSASPLARLGGLLDSLDEILATEEQERGQQTLDRAVS